MVTIDLPPAVASGIATVCSTSPMDPALPPRAAEATSNAYVPG
jgi:hypothetical protein